MTKFPRKQKWSNPFRTQRYFGSDFCGKREEAILTSFFARSNKNKNIDVAVLNNRFSVWLKKLIMELGVVGAFIDRSTDMK